MTGSARAVLLLAVTCALLLSGCQGARLPELGPVALAPIHDTAPAMRRADAADLRHQILAPLPTGEAAPRRLRHTPSWPGTRAGGALVPVSDAPAEAPNERTVYPAPPPDSSAQTDMRLGSRYVVPSRRRRSRTRLRGSIAYRGPEVIDAGVFYQVNDRLTIGVVGQRLEQDRTVDVAGQLIDPNDLNTFVPGFSIREKTTSLTFGPFVQVRLLEERANVPEVSIGAYALEWGSITSASTEYSMPNLILNKEQDQVSESDDPDRYRTIYLSASKRLSIGGRSGFLRGLRAYAGAGYGARTGKRYATVLTGAGNPLLRVTRKDLTLHTFVGWAGAEALLPAGFAGYGEVFTGDECEFGYGFGVRWSSPIGISFSIGISNCVESISQRALDLIYLPGGVGGQPAVVSSGGGLASGGLGNNRPPEDDEDELLP